MSRALREIVLATPPMYALDASRRILNGSGFDLAAALPEGATPGWGFRVVERMGLFRLGYPVSVDVVARPEGAGTRLYLLAENISFGPFNQRHCERTLDRLVQALGPTAGVAPPPPPPVDPNGAPPRLG